MHISILGLVVLVILLTWSARQVDELVEWIVRFAFMLFVVIVAGVVLWFGGKFVLAHYDVILMVLVFFTICATAGPKSSPPCSSAPEPRKVVCRDGDFEAWKRAKATPDATAEWLARLDDAAKVPWTPETWKARGK